MGGSALVLFVDANTTSESNLSDMPSMTIRYALANGEFVEFSHEVIETFSKFRQGRNANEAGGILLGRVYTGSHVVLDKATTPNFLDRAGRYFFDRSRSAAQRIVNKAWRASKGEQNYLGEWHSHPISHPIPSQRDREMIRNMFSDTRRQIGFLFLVVVGTDETWVGIENGKQLKRLKPIGTSIEI